MASLSESDDPWDDLDDKTQEGIVKYTANDLIMLNPSETAKYDTNIENAIRNETYELAKSLGFLEEIVTAAHQVSKHIPDLGENNEHSKFWKEEIIPNLVKCVVQKDEAKCIIVESFASIRNLSITIQKAGEIIQLTKGGQKAIEMAQKNIPRALEKLEKCIGDASALKDLAIQTLASKTKQIFEIIGSEAADFVKRKAGVESQLDVLYDKQDKLYKELANKEGVANRYLFLIEATQKHLLGADRDLEETKRQTNELNRLNAQIEQTIQNIPVSNQKTVTERKTPGFFFWRGTTTTTTNFMTDNKDKGEERKYYESLIISRKKRIQEDKNDEAAKQKVKDDLEKCLAEYKSKLSEAMIELEKFNKTFKSRMEEIQRDIKSKHEQMNRIDSEELVTQNKIGLEGKSLVNCLTAIEKYGEKIKGGAEYAPLVSILEAIKAMVEMGVELLSSENRLEIFMGGAHLLKQTQFLSSYSVSVHQALPPSTQNKSIVNAIE